jgi:hypothetical protein
MGQIHYMTILTEIQRATCPREKHLPGRPGQEAGFCLLKAYSIANRSTLSLKGSRKDPGGPDRVEFSGKLSLVIPHFIVDIHGLREWLTSVWVIAVVTGCADKILSYG